MKSLKSNKQRFLILAAGTILFLFLAYGLSIKKTLVARSECTELELKSRNIQSLQSDLKKWQLLNSSMDQKLGGTNINIGFQENLLGTVGSYCEQHDLSFADFSEPFEGSEGGYQIETIILTIEGRYKQLLQLLLHLETEFKGGRISSVEFLRERNYKSNRDELFLKIYVQNVKRESNET